MVSGDQQYLTGKQYFISLYLRLGGLVETPWVQNSTLDRQCHLVLEVLWGLGPWCKHVNPLLAWIYIRIHVLETWGSYHPSMNLTFKLKIGPKP